MSATQKTFVHAKNMGLRGILYIGKVYLSPPPNQSPPPPPPSARKAFKN